MSADKQRILVIKLSAFGDFIQALGPMKAIRKFHPRAHITLLTTKPFENFARECGYFDEVWLDERPKVFNIMGWVRQARRFNAGAFERVYDLQNNDRTALYFKLFSPRPQWVGAVKGASHCNASPERARGHAFEGHVQTLALAGIKNVHVDTLEWMKGDLSKFSLKKPYVLLIPGCAPDRPEKRWSAEHFINLAQKLSIAGFQPVIIGAAAEKDTAALIKFSCPAALNLVEKTNFHQIAALARGAAGAIGNDTGPMHIIGVTGCPTLVLLSGVSNPFKHLPKGANINYIQKDDINDIAPEDVTAEFAPLSALLQDIVTMH